jgi:hypothetical protein
MKYKLVSGLLAAGMICAALICSWPLAAQEAAAPETPEPPKQLAPQEKLVVVWTSADKDVALKMVFMYTFNAKRFGWWQDITFIVWGPSAKLIAEDEEIQAGIKQMKEAGIDLKACKACSDQLGVSEKLEQQGITVKYMGDELTNYIKEGRHVLTF